MAGGESSLDPVAPSGAARALYSASIGAFLQAPSELIIGTIATNIGFSIVQSQRDAWLVEFALLRNALSMREGTVLLEFSIPRMGRRIDAVVLIGPVVFALEFKVGATAVDRAAIEQVWDYALDLKNFHEASEALAIVPVVVATEATNLPPPELCADNDKVFRPLKVGCQGLHSVFEMGIQHISGETIDAAAWSRAAYRPTPTIIEAARSLYAHHSIEAIARHDAGATNLRVTSQRVEQLADEAMNLRQKTICFVTGVPGAGKTLVGLNVATRHRRELDRPTHAVYLSGNGPLIAVLHEALARDEFERRRQSGEKARKGQIKEGVKAFIQNVHHFRDEALVETGPPFEHVVIFDEAQRAWNVEQTAGFMRRKKKQVGFSMSEPEFLISYMDRHLDWALVICLVGGGQEINTGEAGIAAWLSAVLDAFPSWRVVVSSRLTGNEYAAEETLKELQIRNRVHFDDSLHLAVSMRSFRAENVSAFVKALLDCETHTARNHLATLAGRYPIALTRNLDSAKRWLRSHARGSERFGLVASSKAHRLKPHAIDIRVEVDPVKWFLSDRDDTRSSYYLEDPATEFQVQGLELDWACVTWDGDLRFGGAAWSYHDFRGNGWHNVNKPERRNYLRNAYRVLLTRARQGMVIFVPRGDASDPTRSPDYYDSTFRYLTEIGVPEIE
jgi:hypothetical protein